MAAFVLVHGGFHGGWCWRRLSPHLRAAALALAVLLRCLVFLLRQCLHLPFAFLILAAALGRQLWDLLCSFSLASRLHLRPIAAPESLPDLVGDLDAPVLTPRPAHPSSLAHVTIPGVAAPHDSPSAPSANGAVATAPPAPLPV